MSAHGINDTNLFVYCRNNPISNGDDDGEWVHLVVGAVIGSAVGAISTVLSGGDTTEIVTAAITGAASGALAASGVGLIGSILGNAAISAAGNLANQSIHDRGFKNIDWKDVAVDGMIGAISGAIGGRGASYGNSKSAMSMGSQLVRRVTRTKEIGKAIAYYGKSMRTTAGEKILVRLATSTIRSGSFATGMFSGKKLVRRLIH